MNSGFSRVACRGCGRKPAARRSGDGLGHQAGQIAPDVGEQRPNSGAVAHANGSRLGRDFRRGGGGGSALKGAGNGIFVAWLEKAHRPTGQWKYETRAEGRNVYHESAPGRGGLGRKRENGAPGWVSEASGLPGSWAAAKLPCMLLSVPPNSYSERRKQPSWM